MARQIVILKTDDIDHTQPADETENFTHDGYTYVLDFTTANAKEFRDVLQPYKDAAHEKVKAGKSRLKDDFMPTTRPHHPTKTPSIAEKERRRKVRAWGRANGWKVGEKGVIPTALEEAYVARVETPKPAPEKARPVKAASRNAAKVAATKAVNE